MKTCRLAFVIAVAALRLTFLLNCSTTLSGSGGEEVQPETGGAVPVPGDSDQSQNAKQSFLKRVEADGKIDAEEMQELKRILPDYYRAFVVTTQMTLATLGYNPGPFRGDFDERTRQALKEYRADRHLAPAPDLDTETIDALKKDEVSISMPVVYLPMLVVNTVAWDQDYVSAQGTWVIVGEEQGFPLQTSEITCFKSMTYCVEATSTLDVSGQSDYALGMLSTDLELHEIERWDQYEITTKPDDKACVRYTLRISRARNEVTGLRTTLDTKGPCAGVSKADFHLKLIDGQGIYDNRFKLRQEKRRQLLRANWKMFEGPQKEPEHASPTKKE